MEFRVLLFFGIQIPPSDFSCPKFHLRWIHQNQFPESPSQPQIPDFAQELPQNPGFFTEFRVVLRRADAEAVRGRVVRAPGRGDERPRVHGIRDPHHPPH